jgi:hypothetical protein
MSAFSGDTTQASSGMELYPSERIACMEIIARLNHQYAGKKNSKEELIALANETEARFGNIGLKVIVDIANVELNEKGEDFSSPVIEIVGRISKEETDYEKMALETQSGLLDGKAGKVTADGKFVEPDVKVSLWTPGSKN